MKPQTLYMNKKGMLQLWSLLVVVYLAVGAIFGYLAVIHESSIFNPNSKLYPVKGNSLEPHPFRTFFQHSLLYPLNVFRGNLCPYYDVNKNNYQLNCVK